MKTCTVCKARKPLDSFHNSKRSSDGKNYRCKPCDKEARSKWAKENLEDSRLSMKGRNLKLRYGITLEDYQRMWDEQEGKCKLCGRDSLDRYVVDHCHETGKVRSILCNSCNRGIGYLGDSSERCLQAFHYLETH